MCAHPYTCISCQLLIWNPVWKTARFIWLKRFPWKTLKLLTSCFYQQVTWLQLCGKLSQLAKWIPKQFTKTLKNWKTEITSLQVRSEMLFKILEFKVPSDFVFHRKNKAHIHSENKFHSCFFFAFSQYSGAIFTSSRLQESHSFTGCTLFTNKT